jgi:DsbC/DsbD-like thiol-disulfide interchange protein
MKSPYFIGVLATLSLAGGRVSLAQAPTPVTWSVRTEEVVAIRPGAEARVTVVAVIKPGWHIYSLSQKPGGPIAMSIAVPQGGPFTLAGSVAGPKPETTTQSTFDVPVEWYSDSARFTVPLKLTTSASGPTLEGRIVTRFQACSETVCLPPRSITLPVRLQQRSETGR